MSTSKYNQEFYKRSEYNNSNQPIRVPPIQKRAQRSNSYNPSTVSSRTNKSINHEPKPYSQKLVYQGDRNRQLSVHDFDKNPITTCSFVTVQNVDDYKAQPFYKKPIQQRYSSTENKSMTSTQFQNPKFQYICSKNKKLIPYDPFSDRNKFIPDDFTHQYYNNRSTVVFGKRQSQPEKMDGYKTSNNFNYRGLNLRTEMNNKNPGIAAYWHKWYNRNKL